MPQKFKKIFWTEHSKIKMKQYGLSKQKLLAILSRPERKEGGIAPGTTAAMKTNPEKRTQGVLNGAGKTFFKEKKINLKKAWQKKAPGEIWIMYKDVKDLRKIISAWRFPGVSKPGEEIPIPEDIKQEIISGKIFE